MFFCVFLRLVPRIPVTMYKLFGKAEKAHADAIWSVKWTKNTNLLVTGSVDETVKVWDPTALDQKERHAFDKHDLAVVSVATSGDGALAASSCMDGFIRILDLESGDQQQEINAGAVEAWTVDWHPTRALLASGTHKGDINLWDINQKGKNVGKFEANSKFAMSVAFSPNGQLVACGAFDGAVNVFDVETGAVTYKFSKHAKAVRGLAFSADSTCLLSASQDHHVNLYEMKAGDHLASLAGHSSWVLDVAFNPSGRQFASSSSDKKVKIWDFGTRECVHTFSSHSDQVWSIAYSPDGKQLASVSEDAGLHVYDAHEK